MPGYLSNLFGMVYRNSGGKRMNVNDPMISGLLTKKYYT